MMTVGATRPKAITIQVADVHKALLSISRVADAGFECHLSRAGGYLLDETTGEKVPIYRRGNLYYMRTWVKQNPHAEGFGRLGR